MKKEPVFALLMILLSIVSALLVGEASLRVADRFGWIQQWREMRRARTSSIWMASDNPAIIYRHRPNYRRRNIRHTEANGILRPDDVAVNADGDTLRIAAIGDSVGAALTLPYDRRFLTLVERELTEDGRKTEVLNFCVNGYATSQEAALFEEVVAPFSPDAVILQYCVNDFHPSEYPAWWFRERSASLLIDLFAQQLQRMLTPDYPGSEEWTERYRTDQAGWTSVRDGFNRIGAYCRARSIPALAVIFPLVAEKTWDEGGAAPRQAQVAAAARDAGMHVLDLLPVYAPHPPRQMRRAAGDNRHFSARGHKIAADAILSKLTEIGIRKGGT